MSRREPIRIDLPDRFGRKVSFSNVLWLRANSRRRTDWIVDRDWELIIYSSRKRRSVLVMQPEHIRDIYNVFPDKFLMPKGCPQELAPHPELQSNMERRQHMSRLWEFITEVAYKDRNAWTSYTDVQIAFDRWVATQHDNPEYSADLLAEAMRGERIYRNVDPERGPGFKRLKLR